ncbi:hypothetical protein I302_104358 [Kwoniella bestiolae CBS 10118]|uniref:Ferric oxidoreductase domain-containing protein n=1 Tax=Kwoniella bestiolae CBS 10118 TaxID=1296100 RepID=A0A1B9GB19_9TREE|nr:hypothetical protein I302_03066 [Kwoniella bestiolae CBS 10118]OCF28214.1 hypothetical protein I302_03066 [Kwoniella bestiolae CBS 10118]
MRLPLLLCFTLLCTVVHSVTPDSTGRKGHGLIGYGIDMYSPVCCTACRDVTPTYLYCNPEDVLEDMGGHSMVVLPPSLSRRQHDMDMGMNDTIQGKVATEMPSPECLADNVPYLQTVAYCISTHCGSDVGLEKREEWWRLNIVGRMPDQPDPIMSYQEALSSIHITPNVTLDEEAAMVVPVLVLEDDYIADKNICVNFQRAEKMHSKYGIIILTTCFALPILISFLRFLPFSLPLSNRIHAHLDSPLYPRPISLPLFGQLSLPTRGQSLFVLYLIFINILCCSLDYSSIQPNGWFASTRQEITTYIANRTGVLCLANLPLLFLYAGRNNLLLWLTDWSFSTFILLHKTVGIIVTLEVCIHSAIYLQIYLAKGVESYNLELKRPYWIMGVLATLCFSLILPLSIRMFRKRLYELFIILHISLAVLAVVGSWHHIVWRFDRQWGYELWIIVGIAVWAFDRVFRWVRIARSGGRKYARVYRIDGDYLRVDIDHAPRYRGYVYIHFLDVNWGKSLLPRPWESHPFSVAGYDAPSPVGGKSGSEKEGEVTPKLEELDEHDSQIHQLSSTSMSEPNSQDPNHHTPSEGPHSPAHSVSKLEHHSDSDSASNKRITLLIRVEKGITEALSHLAHPRDSQGVPRSIPILIEGSYGTSSLFERSHKYSKAIAIAGGVGVTALLPKLVDHVSSPSETQLRTQGKVKLFWSVRTEPLVHAVQGMVGQDKWDKIDSDIVIGSRLHLEEILDSELPEKAENGGERERILVLVSGPRGMADEVRRLVTSKARRGINVRFEQESFDW